MTVQTIHPTAADVQPRDHVFVNGAWRPVTTNTAAGPAARVLTVPGAHSLRRASSARVVVRRDVPDTPELPEPTNVQPVTVADFKRAMTPDSRWLVTNHYIDRVDHPSYGTTERTVQRATGSHYYLALPGKDASGITWPKRGQVQRADDGIFLVYGGGAGQAAGDLFLTLRPQS